MITRETLLCIRDWKEKHQNDPFQTSYSRWARFSVIQSQLSDLTSQTPCFSHVDWCHRFPNMPHFLLPYGALFPLVPFTWEVFLSLHHLCLNDPHAPFSIQKASHDPMCSPKTARLTLCSSCPFTRPSPPTHPCVFFTGASTGSHACIGIYETIIHIFSG